VFGIAKKNEIKNMKMAIEVVRNYSDTIYDMMKKREYDPVKVGFAVAKM